MLAADVEDCRYLGGHGGDKTSVLTVRLLGLPNDRQEVDDDQRIREAQQGLCEQSALMPFVNEIGSAVSQPRREVSPQETARRQG